MQNPDEFNNLPVMKKVLILKEVLSCLRKEFDNISHDDIDCTDKSIYFRNGAADKIIDEYCPKLEKSVLYHFTNKNSAKNIIESGKLRLYSPLKRMAQGEISNFISDHSDVFSNFRSKDDQQDLVRSIANHLFYISLVACDLENKFYESLQKEFGFVRLKLSIEPKSADLRRILYNKKFEMLENLNKIAMKNDKKIMLWGISKIPAFYLCNFENEKEIRLLKNCPDDTSVIKDDDKPYIEIPLDKKNDVALIKILECIDLENGTNLLDS